MIQEIRNTNKHQDYESISEIHTSFKSVIQTSHDIIKAHGGEIKVVTNADDGTMSTFVLPE